nr:MAG TPA: tail protein [Caudoviricetes sp.]
MRTYKEIDIRYYDVDGVVHTRCTVPVTESALVHFELMQSHYCKLSFKLGKAVYFKLGDFIETDYGRFELVDGVKPKDDGSLGYSYDLRMEAYYRKWKNKRMKYMPNSGSPEGTFTLTSNISTHANVIVDNLKFLASLGKSYLYDPKYEGGGTDYIFKVDGSVDAIKAKTVTYSNSSILDAISNIAQTFECEWWVEGNIIHFGTCENTNAVAYFRDGENIISMSSSQSQSSYANRVYAFGAARNLPSGYRQNESADVTKNGVVERRLMLPTIGECSDKNKRLLEESGFELKNGYIQVKGLTEDEYVEGVTTNDDIYPRNLIKTSNVTSYERNVEDESTPESGDFVKRTFYRVNNLSIIGDDGEKTGDMAFRSSYILSGKTLHIVFQSGSLNGMDFECQFNPDAKQETLRDNDGNPILKDGKEQVNPESQVFEIVGNEDYGRFLPDTDLHPKDGDTFVLYNWDSTKLGNTLVTSSANELLTDSIKNLKKSMIDPTTYTCTASSDYTYNDGNGMFHQEGDRVMLFNKGYGDSPRESRVIGYELHLDIPFDSVKYIVGEKPAYSWLNAMSSQIEELVFNGQSYVGQGGGGNTTYIIKSYDSVLPTEYNVYSAKAVDSQRASKVKDDTFQGFMRFIKGLRADEKIQLLKGLIIGNNGYSFDENGNIIADSLKSLGFDKALNEGFGMEMDGGQSHLYLANLTVWGKMMINILEIMKTKYAGGNIYMSAAGGTIVKAVPVTYINEDVGWEETSESWCDGWKCYILADDGDEATTNPWQEGDQVRCQSMGNLLGTRYAKATNKSYWRTIPEHGVSSFNEYIYNDYGTPAYNGKMFYWIVLGKHSKDFDGYTEENAPVGTTDIPEAGDSIVLDGSRKDTSRQGVLQLSSYGSGAPSIVGLRGVSDYSHEKCAIFELSYDYVRIFAERFKLIAKNNKVVEITNFRGEWDPTEKYYKNDQVSHNNAIWTCLNAEVWQSEPADDNTAWRKEVYGEKGENGKVGMLFNVDSNWIFDADSDGLVPSDTKKTATIYVTRNGKGVKIANAASNIGRSQNIVRVDGKDLPMTVKDNAVSITLSGENISKQQVGDSNSNVVSVTSGYLLVFIATEDGDSGFVTIPFQVNVARYTGELTLTNQQFKISMDGLTTRMETAEGGITDVNTKLTNEVASLHSEITTTATNVKAEVTEQINGNLKKAGLEVKADGVTLYGDKITITNDDGKTTTALFANGKINASLIDVKHLWAISEDGTNKVGYFGNTEEDACKIGDNTLAPLFVGGATAKESPFYVTSKGAMHATSGTIGGFSILKNQLHSEGSGYAFDIYTDKIVYTDNANQRTLLISSESDDGLCLSLTAADENMSCKLMIGSQDGVGGTIGLLAEKTGYSGRYTQNGLHFGDYFGHYIEAWVVSGSLGRIVPPSAGIACYVSKADNEMKLILRGLPTKKPTAGSTGTIYVENGILKMYTGNF